MSDIFNPPTFGSQLRRARIEAGFTLRTACKEIGLDPGNLSKLENNRLPPPRCAKSIRKLFKVLNDEFDPSFAIDLAYSFHLGSLRKEFYE